MAAATIPALGASEGCSREANSASSQASFAFCLVVAACADISCTCFRQAGSLGGQRRPFEVGQRPAELSAGADAELAEDLVQVVLDSAGAQEQPGADLRIGVSLTGELGDLRFLDSELTGRLSRTLAYVLARGEQFPLGASGEPVHPQRGQHLVSGPQLVPRVHPAVLAAQPLAIDQVSAGQLHPETGAAEPVDGLPVGALSRLALAQQGPRARQGSQRPVAPRGCGCLGQVPHGSGGSSGLPGPGGGLDQLGHRQGGQARSSGYSLLPCSAAASASSYWPRPLLSTAVTQ